MKLKGISIGPGFIIDKKTGKPKRTTKRLSVSTRIAKAKKPKTTYRRGK
jgi:hypothetical protein